MDYSKITSRELRNLLKQEIYEFEHLPRKSSFSGLSISGRIEEIQQEMERRGIEWEEYIAELTIEVG